MIHKCCVCGKFPPENFISMVNGQATNSYWLGVFFFCGPYCIKNKKEFNSEK